SILRRPNPALNLLSVNQDLYSCYFSDDDIVRLRVSNAMKRVCREQPDWFIPFLDGLLYEIAKIEQASTQWTLANLFQMLWKSMDETRRSKAKELLKFNLETWNDWIVLNNTMDSLAAWSSDDIELRNWLIPKLDKLKSDSRRSVSNRALKIHAQLSKFEASCKTS
ncbi:MAG: hypothetical protein MH252_02695, partial [Thermosynechococcaceae cyanobacterium MS004]|nr:hypothetical protein [Thermosynechococcaceae cyanobacterium MS004]